MTTSPIRKYRELRFGLVLSAVAAVSLTLLAGCGGKEADTTTPPPPSATATPDTKAATPPPDKPVNTSEAVK